MFQLDSLLRAALSEDIGWGDITTEACVSGDRIAKGSFYAKENLILCGMEPLCRVFTLLSDKVEIVTAHKDGDFIAKGMVIAAIRGPARAILTGERTALNLLQRMSGIATMTREYTEQVKGTKTRICDTRKTTPGLRILEKYAVRIGGGVNHRMGLSDGILIKDNHIHAAGGITEAVKAARQWAPHPLKIEVETSNLEEVREALAAKADIIMLDNMSSGQMKEALLLIGNKAATEASGNMGDKSLREIAEMGVDYISIGTLTHSVRAVDISLRFDERFL